ncbi:hypothetical protein NQ317_000407 [Molorchus minor]|uniref:PH domain-containing protein n=1 Tax=Molorchus minor TaxID=1323400 RepID=A0ABQ9J9G0_9CUCU|nr:hypothetical protein NQ317_000407 [Molorchus minor]
MIATSQKTIQELNAQLSEELASSNASNGTGQQRCRLGTAPAEAILDKQRDCIGWLSIPSKQNIRRHGWKKQYVVPSPVEKLYSTIPIVISRTLILKVFHVRSVTQGDLLSAGEGEARKTDEQSNALDISSMKNRGQARLYYAQRSREFLNISYHMPSRCRIKIHKDHLDRKEDNVPPCKLHYDPSYAKELLLLASSHDEQRQWVSRLSRKIQKCGFKANNSNAIDSAKISPRLQDPFQNKQCLVAFVNHHQYVFFYTFCVILICCKFSNYLKRNIAIYYMQIKMKFR